MPKYFNTTNAPIVFDDDGRTAGGAEWFESPETDQILRGIDRGEVYSAKPQAKPKEDKVVRDETDPGSEPKSTGRSKG